MDELKKLAYHEAGHIVVGHALRLKVRDVTVVSDGNKAGRAGVPVDSALWYGKEGYVEAQHACYVAGAVAEELLTRKPVKFAPDGEYYSDWQGASDCVIELAGHDLDLQREVGDRAFDQAQRILEKNWEAVASLASALLTAGTLDRQLVEEFLRGVKTPAKGYRVTKAKDGRYVGRDEGHTAGGRKRTVVYGRKYKQVEKKLAELRARPGHCHG